MTVSRFERWLIWLSTAATLVTGLVYWWMKDFMTPVEPWAVINHPLQPWVLKAHILVAPLLVFAVGLITTGHIWRHWRTGVKKGRRSGLIAAVTFGALVVSGYLLQVITAETLLRALGWTHLGLGMFYSAGLALHWPTTRTRVEAGQPTSSPETATGAAAFVKGRPPVHDRRRRRGPASAAR